MTFEAFSRRVRDFAVFGDEVFAETGESPSHRHLQLSRWAKKEKVIRLKRGLYTLSEEFRKAPLSLRWLANVLYSPSYLSLEYMLSWYDMIPERVTAITSISILKTATFRNRLGTFSYRTLKRRLFFGFEEIQDEFHQPILVATPEKALLDSIYLTPQWENSDQFLEKNIRLQQLEQLEKKRLKKFAARFHSKKIDRATDLILEKL